MAQGNRWTSLLQHQRVEGPLTSRADAQTSVESEANAHSEGHGRCLKAATRGSWRSRRRRAFLSPWHPLQGVSRRKSTLTRASGAGSWSEPFCVSAGFGSSCGATAQVRHNARVHLERLLASGQREGCQGVRLQRLRTLRALPWLGCTASLGATSMQCNVAKGHGRSCTPAPASAAARPRWGTE